MWKLQPRQRGDLESSPSSSVVVVRRNKLFGRRTSLSRIPNGFRTTPAYRYPIVMPPCDVKLTTYTSLHPKRVASTSSGTSTSTQNGLTKTTDQFFYPLNVNFTAFDPGFNSCKSKLSYHPFGNDPLPSQGRQRLTTPTSGFFLPVHSWWPRQFVPTRLLMDT